MGFNQSFESFAARLRHFISEAARACCVAPQNDRVAGSDTEFNHLALELFALQFRNNSPYRQICCAKGISPRSVADWRQIPSVPAAAFKELELSCIRPEDRTAVFHSSGTTGQRPSRHFHNGASLSIYEASLWPWFTRHFLSHSPAHAGPAPCPAPAFLSLTPPPVAAPHSSLVHMFDTVRRNLGHDTSCFLGTVALDGSWNLNPQRTEAALKKAIAARQPVFILGTAFSFVHLLDYLCDQGMHLPLPPGSRVLETGGYKGRSRALPKTVLHELISTRLGIALTDIVCEYGMSELGSQAYAQPFPDSRAGWLFPPWARAQIISPESGDEVSDGQTGLLRVFDLANVYSVLAVQTEDLCVRQDRGFDLLGRAALSEPRGCSLMAG